MHRNILFASCAFAALLYGMNRLAIEYSLYWKLWWYDIPMHFLGGLILGGIAVWFFGSLHERFEYFRGLSVPVFTLGFVLFGGIAWEIYEYHYGLSYNPMIGYWVDTLKDLSMDVVGCFSVLWYYQKKKEATAVIHD